MKKVTPILPVPYLPLHARTLPRSEQIEYNIQQNAIMRSVKRVHVCGTRIYVRSLTIVECRYHQQDHHETAAATADAGSRRRHGLDGRSPLLSEARFASSSCNRFRWERPRAEWHGSVVRPALGTGQRVQQGCSTCKVHYLNAHEGTGTTRHPHSETADNDAVFV